jgi:hypothetical protein
VFVHIWGRIGNGENEEVVELSICSCFSSLSSFFLSFFLSLAVAASGSSSRRVFRVMLLRRRLPSDARGKWSFFVPGLRTEAAGGYFEAMRTTTAAQFVAVALLSHD